MGSKPSTKKNKKEVVQLRYDSRADIDYNPEVLPKPEMPVELAPTRPLMTINYWSLQNWAHYGKMIKDATETEFPGHFDFKLDMDFSSVPKLVISIKQDEFSAEKWIHSTLDGDPFITEKEAFIEILHPYVN